MRVTEKDPRRVGGGLVPSSQATVPMLGFRHFSSRKSPEISQPLLQNRVLVHLCGNEHSSPFATIMLLRRGSYSHITLDQVKQGSLTISSRKWDCSLERGKNFK